MRIRTFTVAPDSKVEDRACGHANEPGCIIPPLSSSDGTSLLFWRNWYSNFLAGPGANSSDVFSLVLVGIWLGIAGFLAAVLL